MNSRLILIRIVKSLGFVLACLVFSVLVLVGTEPGTRWVVNTALSLFASNDALRVSVDGLEGTLTDRLNAAELTIQAGETRITAGELVLAWNPLALLDDSLDIRTLSAQRLAIQLPATSSSEEASGNPLDALFNLPVSVQLRNLDVQNMAIAGENPLSLAQISGRLDLDASLLKLQANVVQDSSTSLVADVSLEQNANISGSLRWQTAINEIAANGELQLTGTVERLNLVHQLNAPLVVNSEGQLVTGLFDGSQPAFNLVHLFDNVSGQALGITGLASGSGQLDTRGTTNGVEVSLAGMVDLTALGLLDVQVNTRLAGTDLDISTLALRGDSLSFTAAGNAALGSERQLQLAWDLDDFSDGSLLSGIELNGLSGSGALSLTANAQGSDLRVTLAGLQGLLNGYSLSGDGEVRLLDGRLSRIDLDLDSGGNRLQVQGSLEPELDLEWTLQAPELGRLLSGLAGEVSGIGSLTGSRDNPELNGELDGRGMVYQAEGISVALNGMTGEARYGAAGNRINLNLENLSVHAGELRIRQARSEFQLSGSPERHEFSLASYESDPAILLSGSAGYASGSWQGLFNTVNISSSYGDWQLQEPLTLALAGQQVVVGDHCWQWLDISLCGDLDWRAESGAQGHWQLANLPLVFLNRTSPEDISGLEALAASLANRPAGITKQLQRYNVMMPAGSTLEGHVDVDLSFDGLGAAASASYSLSAELTPDDLRLGFLRPVMEDDEQIGSRVERYGLDDMNLAVNRIAGGWSLESGFSVYVGESGGLDFQGSFQGMLALEDGGDLAGDFELAFNNIAWLEALIPDMRDVKGNLSAGGKVGGNMARPLLQMDAKLDGGAVVLPAYGLSLEDMVFTLHSEGENEVDLNGSLRSGEGTLSLASRVVTPLLASRQMTADINGENVLVINRPEALVHVNPDIHLAYQDQQLAVSGSLDVPLMNLDLREGQSLVANGGVAVSRDAVVTVPDTSRPRQGNSAEAASRIPVSAEVHLGLGDNVHFQGYGLDMMLAGNLDLEQSVDRPMLAHGELAIPTGTYGLYGQELSITDGKLLFLGNPLNPALDMRALRQTPDAEVGVQMNGTVSKIRAQLYSTPTLPESEILSLLITGKSFSNGAELGGQDGESMLGAIALLGVEQGQGLTGSVSSKLGLDTVAINSGENYRDSSLGLGKYIKPNLFMRYDIGLFDRQNVLTLDYLLSEKLKLQVETGVSQSVDLTYTVEK